MDRDAVNAGAAVFDLPRVQAGSDLESQRAQSLIECKRAADRASRTVEGRQDAISGGPDETSTVLFQDGSGDHVVAIKDVTPCAITNSRELLSGPNHVGEQNGRQCPIGFDVAVESLYEVVATRSQSATLRATPSRRVCRARLPRRVLGTAVWVAIRQELGLNPRCSSRWLRCGSRP